MQFDLSVLAAFDGWSSLRYGTHKLRHADNDDNCRSCPMHRDLRVLVDSVCCELVAYGIQLLWRQLHVPGTE